MTNRIIEVTSSNAGLPVPSGGTVTATVTYQCSRAGKQLRASGVTDGFTVGVQPPAVDATPSITPLAATFQLVITRTTAAPDEVCEVQFSMNAPRARSKSQFYQVE